MDNKIILISYYAVSLVLAIMMIRGTPDKGYKTTGVLFAITFLYFLISYLGLITRMGLDFITITIAFTWYVVKRIRSSDSRLLDEIFLVMLPLVTVVRLAFRVLHLNGWNELGLFSIIVLLIASTYLLIFYVRKKTFREIKEAVELNGLFAVILVPSLV